MERLPFTQLELSVIEQALRVLLNESTQAAGPEKRADILSLANRFAKAFPDGVERIVSIKGHMRLKDPSVQARVKRLDAIDRAIEMNARR